MSKRGARETKRKKKRPKKRKEREKEVQATVIPLEVVKKEGRKVSKKGEMQLHMNERASRREGGGRDTGS